MQKRYLWSYVLSLAATIFITAPQVLASSLNSNLPLCYIQISPNKQIDLSSICGYSSRQNTAYLADIQKLIKGTEEDKQLQELLNNNPDLLINAAKNYCNARRAGLSEKEMYERKQKEFIQEVNNRPIDGQSKNQNQQFETSMTALSIASNLASRIYCPT